MFDMIWARWFSPEPSNYAGGVRPCSEPAGLGEVNDKELNRLDEAIKSSALGGREYVKFAYLCEMLPEPIRKYRKMIHEFIPEVIEQAYGKEKESLHVGGFIGALLGFKTGLVDDLPRNLCRDALELLFDPLGTVCDIIDSVMPNNPDNCVAQIMRAWQAGDDFSRGRIVGNITGQVAIIVASKKFSAKVASGRALEAASAASEVGSAAGVAEAAGEAASVAKETQSAASVAKGAKTASKAASVAKETQSAAKVAKGAEAVAKSTAGAAKNAETVAKSAAGAAKEAETVAKGVKAAGGASTAAKEAKGAAGAAKEAETVAKGAKAAGGANTAAKEAKGAAGVAKGAETAAGGAEVAVAEVKADFYVKPNGELVPSTGYRYMDSRYANQTLESMEAPGSYFGVEKFDSAAAARDAYQVSTEWSNCRLRGQFDTLHVIDEVRVPRTFGDKGTSLEPITRCYPEYGKGGHQQFICKDKLKFDQVDIIGE